MSRIPASGAMRWLDIQNSFGGSNPIGINEYYRTSTYVPNSDINSDIPTSGQIEASDFRGADGFSGTTASFTAGTGGGKSPPVGYEAGSYGSNLGTALTSGSVGNGSFKFNIYRFNKDIIGFNLASTIVAPATANQSAMASKVAAVSGYASFNVQWQLGNQGTIQTPPSGAGFGTGASDGVSWTVGAQIPNPNAGGQFTSGQTFNFSLS